MQQSLGQGSADPGGNAVAASGRAGPSPLTPGLVLRVLAVGTAVATFLSLLGPFNEPARAVATRTIEYFVFGWIGSMLGLLSVRVAARFGLWPRPLALGAAAGLLMAGPMLLAVWAVNTLANGHPPPRAAAPAIIWDTVLICLGASIVSVFAGRGRRSAPPVGEAPPRFLERLPQRLRGAEIWAVEAEDHYLRLHTSKGQDLILLRLSDAIDELDGLEGAQVHRSWWVARQGIVEARRGDGRAVLTLQDGSEAPVSRTYARALRARGWI